MNAHGGKRSGAGRPLGARGVLPRGAVKAIKSLRHRVPPTASAEAGQLADEAFAQVVAIMRKPGRSATVQLAAATVVRDEICGPVPRKSEISGPGGEPLTVTIKSYKREPTP